MQHFWGLVQDPPHKTLQTPHHRVAKNPAVSFYRSFSPPKRETISKRQPGNIPGRIEVPITDPALIAAYFPEIRPTWDYNMVEGGWHCCLDPLLPRKTADPFALDDHGETWEVSTHPTQPLRVRFKKRKMN
ncbi:uncharacterized protein [Dipodomys merriami]|uniref:uncharacterized protein isoform X2 n=1 Tax=Dipodomys merriami TaxID=94247 RepID=UPI00384F5B88